jgi:putative transposase
VSFFQEAFGLSRRRACGLAQISRSVVEYRSRRPDDKSLRERILAWACERSRYGYRRIHLLLRREGWNRKRVYRIYREEALSVRRRKRKQVAVSPRQAIVVPSERMSAGRWTSRPTRSPMGGRSGR